MSNLKDVPQLASINSGSTPMMTNDELIRALDALACAWREHDDRGSIQIRSTPPPIMAAMDSIAEELSIRSRMHRSSVIGQ